MERAVFVDRDGVLIIDPPHYAHRLDQLNFYPRVEEAIKILNENGFLVVVVTNQNGVAIGYYNEEDVKLFHQAMKEKLKEKGAYIDAIYYCPHHPEAKVEKYRLDCDCRKPNPGMLLKAAEEHDIDLKQSFMIGDKCSDIEAGIRAGCKKTILVKTGHGMNNLNKCSYDYEVNNIYEVACLIEDYILFKYLYM